MTERAANPSAAFEYSKPAFAGIIGVAREDITRRLMYLLPKA